MCYTNKLALPCLALFIFSIKYQSCIEIMGKAGCCKLNWSLYHECHCNQYGNSNLDFCTKIQIQKVKNVSLYQTVAERARSCWGNILPHKSQLYCTCWESLCCASSQEIFLPTMPLSGFFFLHSSCKYFVWVPSILSKWSVHAHPTPSTPSLFFKCTQQYICICFSLSVTSSTLFWVVNVT